MRRRPLPPSLRGSPRPSRPRRRLIRRERTASAGERKRSRSSQSSCRFLRRVGLADIDLFSLKAATRLFLLLPRVRHVVMRRRYDRNDEAEARCRKHLAPVADQALVGTTDVSDVAVEVIEAERVDVP